MMGTSSLLKSISHLAPVAPSNAQCYCLGPPGGDLRTSARRSVPVVSRHKPARPRPRYFRRYTPASCSYAVRSEDLRIRGQDPRRGLVVYRSIIIPPHAILVRLRYGIQMCCTPTRRQHHSEADIHRQTGRL